MEKTQKINTRQLTLIGVMAAVTCILGPLSLPIGVVPISLTNLVIYFAIYALHIHTKTKLKKLNLLKR